MVSQNNIYYFTTSKRLISPAWNFKNLECTILVLLKIECSQTEPKFGGSSLLFRMDKIPKIGAKSPFPQMPIYHSVDTSGRMGMYLYICVCVCQNTITYSLTISFKYIPITIALTPIVQVGAPYCYVSQFWTNFASDLGHHNVYPSPTIRLIFPMISHLHPHCIPMFHHVPGLNCDFTVLLLFPKK